MNCKQGDLAFIKTTHPLSRLHGLMVECLAHSVDEVEGDIWAFKFAGGPQKDDQGEVTQEGWIQDRHLRPIKPLGREDVDVTSHGIHDRHVVTV